MGVRSAGWRWVMWWSMPEAGEQQGEGAPVRRLAVAGSIQRRQRTVLTLVPLRDVHPNPDQPRKHFDEEKLSELAASIRAHGLLQPIVVRPTPAGLEIVAGERRFRAALPRREGRPSSGARGGGGGARGGTADEPSSRPAPGRRAARSRGATDRTSPQANQAPHRPAARGRLTPGTPGPAVGGARHTRCRALPRRAVTFRYVVSRFRGLFLRPIAALGGCVAWHATCSSDASGEEAHRWRRRQRESSTSPRVVPDWNPRRSFRRSSSIVSRSTRPFSPRSGSCWPCSRTRSVPSRST